MQCKATTSKGKRCMNSSLKGKDYCYAHRGEEEKAKRRTREESDNITCSFCGLERKKVRKLISGSAAYICDECVNICIEVLFDEKNFDPSLLPSIYQKSRIPKTRIHQPYGVDVNPRFNTFQPDLKKNHCLHLCPYREPYNTIFNGTVKPILEKEGFTVNRSDEKPGAQATLDGIWKEIYSSEVIIAEVTGKDPDIMYQIGMAHTVGKPVIILSQSMDDIPFDLKYTGCLIYTDTPKGMEMLEAQIAGLMRFIKG